jgi:hypothetical protein
MSLNDLTAELSKTSVLDDSIQRKLLEAVLKLLDDKNSAIQNLAIKRYIFALFQGWQLYLTFA